MSSEKHWHVSDRQQCERRMLVRIDINENLQRSLCNGVGLRSDAARIFIRGKYVAVRNIRISW